MCVTDAEQVGTERPNSGGNNSIPWPMHCEFLHNQMGNPDDEPAFTGTSDRTPSGNSFPVRFLLPSHTHSFLGFSFLLLTLLLSFWVFPLFCWVFA